MSEEEEQKILEEFYLSTQSKQRDLLREKIGILEREFYRIANNPQRDLYILIKGYVGEKNHLDKKDLISFCEKIFK